MIATPENVRLNPHSPSRSTNRARIARVVSPMCVLTNTAHRAAIPTAGFMCSLLSSGPANAHAFAGALFYDLHGSCFERLVFSERSVNRVVVDDRRRPVLEP